MLVQRGLVHEWHIHHRDGAYYNPIANLVCRFFHPSNNNPRIGLDCECMLLVRGLLRPILPVVPYSACSFQTSRSSSFLITCSVCGSFRSCSPNPSIPSDSWLTELRLPHSFRFPKHTWLQENGVTNRWLHKQGRCRRVCKVVHILFLPNKRRLWALKPFVGTFGIFPHVLVRSHKVPLSVHREYK